MTNTSSSNDFIPLKPIADLNSLEATGILSINGLIEDKPVQGALKGLLTMNGPKSKVTVSGNLLGEITARIGGSLVALFTPTALDLYKVPDGAYVVINGLFAVCVKPNMPKATAVLDEMSPQNLLVMLTTSDVARGEFVGQEMINGRRVKHYVIDGETFLAAAKQSSDLKLRTFAAGLWSAGDADLYVDAENSYPIAFRGSYSGAYEPLKFKGHFDIQTELTGINPGTPVNLPGSCDNPVSM
jgi:hypothetical protein